MAIPAVRTLAHEFGINVKVVDKLWDKAQSIAFDTFTGGDTFSVFALEILKMMLTRMIEKKKEEASEDKGSDKLDFLLKELDDLESTLDKAEEAALLRIVTSRYVKRVRS